MTRAPAFNVTPYRYFSYEGAGTLDLKIIIPSRAPTHIPSPIPKNTKDCVDSYHPYLNKKANHSPTLIDRRAIAKKCTHCHGESKPLDHAGTFHFLAFGQTRWCNRRNPKEPSPPIAAPTRPINIRTSIEKVSSGDANNPALRAPDRATSLIPGQILNLFSTSRGHLNANCCTGRTLKTITRKTTGNTAAQASIGSPAEPRKT
jgi:hypothetical protein